MSNGELFWNGRDSGSSGIPVNMVNRLYRAIYEMWDILRLSSNVPNNAYASCSHAWYYDAPSYSDKTTEFNNSDVNDFYFFPSSEQVDDGFYYGLSSRKFDGLKLNIYRAATGSATAWEYWNGTAWVVIPGVTDNTSMLTVVGTNTVEFTAPSDWEETSVNGVEMYWVRSRVSVRSYSLFAIGAQGWLYSVAPLDYECNELGLYSFEDTAANYCMICGKSEHEASWNGDYGLYFYNTILPGKTIYCHAISYGYKHVTGSYERFDYSMFVMNDNILFNNDAMSSTSDWSTKGFRNLNIEDIDAIVGIQNIFKFSAHGYTSGVPYPDIWFTYASVLIVS